MVLVWSVLPLLLHWVAWTLSATGNRRQKPASCWFSCLSSKLIMNQKGCVPNSRTHTLPQHWFGFKYFMLPQEVAFPLLSHFTLFLFVPSWILEIVTKFISEPQFYLMDETNGFFRAHLTQVYTNQHLKLQTWHIRLLFWIDTFKLILLF